MLNCLHCNGATIVLVRYGRQFVVCGRCGLIQKVKRLGGGNAE
jgi:hypothetical protein